MSMKLSALFIYVAIGIVVVLPASSFAQKPSTVPTKLSPCKTHLAKIKAHSILDGITGLADNSQVTLLEMVFQPLLRKCDNELCKRSPQYRIINILAKVSKFTLDSIIEDYRVVSDHTLKSEGDTPVYVASYFVTEHDVPGVELEEFDTTYLFKREIKERRLTMTLKATCKVDCRVNLDKGCVEYNASKKTWIVHLPKPELLVHRASDSDCEWIPSYEGLRGEWCDKSTIANLKASLFTQLPTMAVEAFKRGDKQEQMVKKLLVELGKLLQIGRTEKIELVFSKDE